MKHEEIKLLVEQARTGDQQAFATLYEATHQDVYRTIHAMLKSEELAMDVQQDTYVRAFSHLDQLGDPEKFLPWLRAIAVNQTKSALRKQQPVLFSELEYQAGADLPEIPDQSTERSPELALDRKETSRLVREILDDLTDAQRMLVGMYYYEQIPVKQIAEDLGVSQSTVKTQLDRSRKKVEAEVRRLEKKGVKLYGLSPLPFLLGLLRNERLEAEAGKKVLAAAVNEVVKPAALHVGRAFFETLAGKLVLGVLAAGVIGGGIAGWRFVSRLNATYGDTRPTDSSFEAMLEHRESNEDLPTLPVTTEPVTEPDTTEPVTEPDTTEPVTETTVDSSGDLPPAQPAPAPTNPPPTEPKPTEPTPQPTEEETVFVKMNFGYSPQEEYPWYFKNTNSRVHVVVRGPGIPQLTTDNPDMIELYYDGLGADNDLAEGEHEYNWNILVRDYGVGTLICELNGRQVAVKTVRIDEYPVSVVSFDFSNRHTSGPEPYEKHVTNTVVFHVVMEGDRLPNLYADHPEILRIGQPQEVSSVNTVGRQKEYLWACEFLEEGTVTVYCEFNGEIVGSYTFTVKP